MVVVGIKCSKRKSTELFDFYLNDEFHGRGSLEYMMELARSYVVDSEMYGRDSCKISIKQAMIGELNGEYAKKSI